MIGTLKHHCSSNKNEVRDVDLFIVSVSLGIFNNDSFFTLKFFAYFLQTLSLMPYLKLNKIRLGS